MVFSSSRYSKNFGSITKNPPFIQPSSILGFSIKEDTKLVEGAHQVANYSGEKPVLSIPNPEFCKIEAKNAQEEVPFHAVANAPGNAVLRQCAVYKHSEEALSNQLDIRENSPNMVGKVVPRRRISTEGGRATADMVAKLRKETAKIIEKTRGFRKKVDRSIFSIFFGFEINARAYKSLLRSNQK